MATTSPDNIQYPVGTDQVAPLADHFKNLADSTQAALNTKITSPAQEANIADGAVTSAKIANGTIVDADVSGTAAIAPAKIAGTAVTQADTGTVTGTMIADNTITSVDLATLDYIKFNTAYSGGSTQPGMLNWNDTDGTLEFQLKGSNVTLQVGQEQVVRVKNETGAALSNGKAVYISGSNGVNLLASYANAGSENTSVQTIGITTETIGIGGHGFVTTFGLVRDIDTNNLIEGAAVWLDTTNGGLTATRPAAPNHGVLLGFCIRKSATVGVIFVRVDNGWELDELHNVSITSPTNGQGLTYDAATQMWKNATPISALSGLSDVTITSPVSGEKLVYNGTKWVNLASAGSAFTVSDTAPSLTTASEGDAWVNSSNGTMAVCYVDPDGTKLWLQVQANSALEASILARLGQLESSAIALGTYSPNYIINGGFDIWQRGTSQTSSGYGSADRWYITASASTSWARDTAVLAPGTQASLKATVGASAAGVYILQAIETQNVMPFTGKTVTLSAYLSSSASSTFRFLLEYSTSTDNALTGTWTTADTYSFSTTSTLTRYSRTVVVPATAKSIRVNIGSDSVAANSVVYFAGVQLEAGSTATSFRRNAPSIQAELAACQRYYYRISAGGIYGQFGDGWTTSTTNMNASIQLPVPMRTVPTSIDYSGAFEMQLTTNAGYTITSLSLSTVESTNTRPLLGAATSSVPANYAGHWRSQNNGSSYVGFNAEL